MQTNESQLCCKMMLISQETLLGYHVSISLVCPLFGHFVFKCKIYRDYDVREYFPVVSVQVYSSC
jgi:hypothetical protein